MGSHTPPGTASKHRTKLYTRRMLITIQRGGGVQDKPAGGYPHPSQIPEIRTETYKIKKYFIEARYVFKLSPI